MGPARGHTLAECQAQCSLLGDAVSNLMTQGQVHFISNSQGPSSAARGWLSHSYPALLETSASTNSAHHCGIWGKRRKGQLQMIQNSSQKSAGGAVASFISPYLRSPLVLQCLSPSDHLPYSTQQPPAHAQLCPRRGGKFPTPHPYLGALAATRLSRHQYHSTGATLQVLQEDKASSPDR